MLMPIWPVRDMSSLESRFSKLGLGAAAALLLDPVPGPDEVLGRKGMVGAVGGAATATVAGTTGAEDLGVLGGGGGGRGRSR
jgi:hypothetical protein